MLYMLISFWCGLYIKHVTYIYIYITYVFITVCLHIMELDKIYFAFGVALLNSYHFYVFLTPVTHFLFTF